MTVKWRSRAIEQFDVTVRFDYSYIKIIYNSHVQKEVHLSLLIAVLMQQRLTGNR